MGLVCGREEKTDSEAEILKKVDTERGQRLNATSIMQRKKQ